MATTCPLNFNVGYLREQVCDTYDQVARDPNRHYHFHRGPDYAHTFLGYDPNELATLPALSTERFAGVGNPLVIGPLAAHRTGPGGHAIGIDMTPAMVECTRKAAVEAGLSERVEVHQGFYEELPVADASVDVVISNGVLNLAPDKRRVLGEVFRVLRPGG